MNRHVVTSRPEIGYESSIEYDNDLGVVGVQRQNVDAIKESVRAQNNAWQAGSLIGNTQRHQEKVADIPIVIYYDLLDRFGRPDQNPKAWFRWLRENSAFATTRRWLS